VVFLAVALLLLLAGPGPAAAADEHGAPANAEAHGEKESAPAYADLGLWSIVIFVLLLLVLRRFAWGPMLDGLHRREQAIHTAVEEARRARDEAHKLREQFEQEMARAHDRVRGLLDQARKDGTAAREQLMADARREIQTDRERLHREVEGARDTALQQVMSRMADLAALVSAKAIGRHISPDDHRRLIDEALADLGKTRGNGRGPGHSTP
jgi:F-type H+-transporting ATPase subunit b